LLFRKTNRARIVTMAVFLVAAVGLSWAQSDGGSQEPPIGWPGAELGRVSDTATAPDPAAPPAPAYPPTEGSLPPYELNPPIVGLNAPGLAPPGMETRSFFIPGALVSQAVDADQGGTSSTSELHGVTRGLGSLTLQRLWRRYDLALDYLGGAGYYSNRTQGLASLQLLDVDQHISWSRGQFAIRDSFSYLPEGNFGAGSFGGTGALSAIGGLVGGLAGLGILGPGQFATFGEQPRITNISIADVTEFISPRSSVSAVGSYGFVHFTDHTFGLINSHQFVGQVSYDYQLNRKDQVALLYAYQTFKFPSVEGNDFNTNLVNLLFGRRISGRVEFIAGGGPQVSHIKNPVLGSTDRVTFSGRVSLDYRLEKARLALSFFRYNTNGSGFSTGATTDLVRFSVGRPLGRRWIANLDVGYTHNSLIGPSLFVSRGESFDYVYAGGSLHRQLGREFSGFVSYQFSNIGSRGSLCIRTPSCSYTTQRQVALIGVDWHPHPIRID
jgi:hypothetical protein